MLMLLFYLDNERYALKSRQIVEVAPLVELTKRPHAPDYLSGVFNYRGQIVPVIDLSQLIQGRPCHAHLSTRIILVNDRLVNDRSHPLSKAQTVTTPNGSEQSGFVLPTQTPFLLGLMAERVVETLNVSETDLIDDRMQIETAPYLGKIILAAQGMIQCICIENLLTEEQRSCLFATHDAVGS